MRKERNKIPFALGKDRSDSIEALKRHNFKRSTSIQKVFKRKADKLDFEELLGIREDYDGKSVSSSK